MISFHPKNSDKNFFLCFKVILFNGVYKKEKEMDKKIVILSTEKIFDRNMIKGV